MGPTGTGKSAYVQDKMMNGLSKDKFLPTFVNFSAQTSANMTQVMTATCSGLAPNRFCVGKEKIRPLKAEIDVTEEFKICRNINQTLSYVFLAFVISQGYWWVMADNFLGMGIGMGGGDNCYTVLTFKSVESAMGGRVGGQGKSCHQQILRIFVLKGIGLLQNNG